ncbi:MAG: nucleotidyltransferase domain-containing protein [Bacteroidales bacterium]|nr:nucleotidyltransferase domain-containing protein [Bacteroidales bacterium]
MYGLKDIHIEKIQSVFTNCEFIEKAILYGSRAKGNYRNNSDIDISLVGKAIDLTILLKLENQLDDLLLPYTIDLSIFYKIENTDLIDHINRLGIVLYEKAEVNE